MFIKEDYSYLSAIDKTAIEQGIAALAVYSFRLDRYFTESQMAANRTAAQTLTQEEWIKRCADIARKVGEQNETVLSALENAGLILGQYRPTPNQNHYDLWFWCNCGNEGRKLDYVTLTVNNSLPYEQQQKIVERTKTVLESVNTVGNCAIVQYKAQYDEQKVAEIAEQFAEQSVGKFVKNGFYTGKIVQIDPNEHSGYKYAFKKKNAKTRGIYLDVKDLYVLSLENAA